jgi:DDE superfamily endonuclease
MCGPKGAAYTCSSSGWFDMFIFEDWFEKILMPAVHHLEGKKVLVGDNLLSHISLKVIQQCRKNDRVCLPAAECDAFDAATRCQVLRPLEEWLACAAEERRR